MLTGRYPLVNVYITMENHHFVTRKFTIISMTIFNSKLLVITRGWDPEIPRVAARRGKGPAANFSRAASMVAMRGA